VAVWGPRAVHATAAQPGDAAEGGMPARPPHRWWDIVLVPVLSFALLIVLIAGAMLALRRAGIALPGDTAAFVERLAADPVIQNAAGILVYMLLAGLLALLLALRGHTLRQVHFRAFKGYVVILAALAGVALAYLVAYAMQRLPAEALAEIEAAEAFALPGSLAGMIVLGLLAVLVAPVVEELYFRGIVMPVLARRFSFVAAATVSSAYFSSIHGHLFVLSGIGAWTVFGLLFLVGVVLACAARWTGSLYAPVAMHAAYNAALFLPAFALMLTGAEA